MKAIFYACMLTSLVYMYACGNKEVASQQNETHIYHEHDNHDHGHEHSHGDSHIHSHDGHGECNGEHSHDHVPDENTILFTSHQASHVLGFEVKEIKPQPFYHILKTSGQILPAPGDEMQIVASASGIVSLLQTNFVEGYAVSKGQKLFSISGRDLSDNNLSSRIAEARFNLENTKSEYDRAIKLAEDKIISDRELQQAKLSYEQAQITYNTLSEGTSETGKSITSPLTGYVKELYVQPGQYVETGEILGIVSQNRNLILRADVSQRYISQIKEVQTACFTTPYDNQVYELENLNGKLVSIGKNSGTTSFYTPINFEFENRGNIIPGSFVEVYLKTKPISNALVLPKTALIEEQGYFFVFVQVHEEDYIKKEVRTGGNDGVNIQIVEGISEGEKVVTQGAYAIKLASVANAMPEHSHEH